MLTSKLTENNFLLTDIVPSMPQLLDNAKPLQTRTSEPAVPLPYPETAYQWLVGALDGLIDFGQRHGHYGVIIVDPKNKCTLCSPGRCGFLTAPMLSV